MPRKCCVPGCNSNYDSEIKKGGPVVSAFRFPKDEERKKLWLLAIPRKDFSPTANSVVCMKHFSEDDIIRYDLYKTKDGTTQQLLLMCPKLKEDALPRIFPNLPKYLTKEKSVVRNDPQERKKKVFNRTAAAIDNFLKADIIQSFENVKNDFASKVESVSKWHVIMKNSELFFYTLSVDYDNGSDEGEHLYIVNSVKLDQNMRLKVVIKGNELSSHELKWILP
mgnify:FL=1